MRDDNCFNTILFLWQFVDVCLWQMRVEHKPYHATHDDVICMNELEPTISVVIIIIMILYLFLIKSDHKKGQKYSNNKMKRFKL